MHITYSCVRMIYDYKKQKVSKALIKEHHKGLKQNMI